MEEGERSACMTHWSEIELPDDRHYEADDEIMAIDAPFAQHFGLDRLGIHHQRLLPGRRTSYPHAESAEQEFIYVLAGTPDLWLDGELHRLKPGDGVGFAAGTGICHSFLNNTESEVHLLVVGETPKSENLVFYPLNPDRKALRADWWEAPPHRVLGPHDGLTDKERLRKALKKSAG